MFLSKTIPNMIWNAFLHEEPYLHLKLYVWSRQLYV